MNVRQLLLALLHQRDYEGSGQRIYRMAQIWKLQQGTWPANSRHWEPMSHPKQVIYAGSPPCCRRQILVLTEANTLEMDFPITLFKLLYLWTAKCFPTVLALHTQDCFQPRNSFCTNQGTACFGFSHEEWLFSLVCLITHSENLCCFPNSVMLVWQLYAPKRIASTNTTMVLLN